MLRLYYAYNRIVLRLCMNILYTAKKIMIVIVC